jgi:3-methylcrotonyl-CoA carboxylase alpha subunit
VRLFSKLLVANRGEIAVRVARTCRVMGQPTVAIYSEADRDALHVRECDEAELVGPAEAARSYLDVGAIIDAARRSGADAVHPGYGFLSEDAGFAAAVADAGLTFVGPPAAVHARMGDKRGARRIMAAAGVAVVPGYDGDDQSEERLAAEGERIGWPVMIKPSRGGGGKGMRVVGGPSEFEAALQASRREARSAFGDESVILERFVERPRHVEVQVLADAAGAAVHLLERECSIQRRHQKVIEETPSPALTESLRRELCAAALAAARTAGYLNAGTVEFLLDAEGRFYFLEMNTRLQVEHPITEAVTGFDLVRLQLEIAAGRELSFEQSDVVGRGHALECRIYAEDPHAGDLPSAGRVLAFSAPRGPGIRCDEGVATGSDVPVHYDPLVAKLVTWGSDRNELLERTDDALRRTVVLGVATNLPRLRSIVEHAAFRSGEIHTGFIDEHLRELPRPAPPGAALVAAALAALEGLRGGATSSGGAGAPPDPWSERTGWRLGAERPR